MFRPNKNINPEKFYSRLDTIITEGEELAEKLISKKVEDANSWINIWNYGVIQYLEDSVDPKPDELINIFRRTKIERLLHVSNANDMNVEKLQDKIDNLKYLRGLIKMIDSFNQKKLRDPKSFKVEDRLDFILERLNEDNSEIFFSIEHLLKFNEIPYRENEPNELADLLHKKQHVRKKEVYTFSDEVKISVKGSSYIERKLKIAKTKRKKSQSESLNTKVDEIIERLRVLGFGQEIIFDELDELKTLNKVLNKKNWKQVLKGKLLDLAVSQVITKEAVNYIYEQLAGEPLKLLGK